MNSATAVNGCGNSDQWTEVVSSEPRISIVHNFLSKEECEHLINRARPYMTRSLVADPKNPKVDVISSARTSTGIYLSTGPEDKVAQDIGKRIADYTSLPVENGEGIQVIHYEVEQKFDTHQDYFNDERKVMVGSQRAVTVLMYLSDVEEGGETFFPNAKSANCIISSSNVRVTDDKGVYVKPKMGDALVFWNIKPDGTVDPLSRHGSSPLIKGDKWACTIWMHDTQYKYFVRPPLNVTSNPTRAKTSLTNVSKLSSVQARPPRARPPRGRYSARLLQPFKNPGRVWDQSSVHLVSGESGPSMPRRSARISQLNTKHVNN